MKPRRLAVGAVLVLVAFLCGVLVSDRVLGPPAPGDEWTDATDEAADAETLASAAIDAASETRHNRSPSRTGRGEVQRLRAELARKDAVIAELRGGDRENGGDEPAAPDDADSEGGEKSRRHQRWERIQESLSGVMPALVALEDEGTDVLDLGPHVLAELRKVTAEQFAELVAFDADETDPEIFEPIRVVMIQALIHAPAAAPLRDAYLSRVLDRVKTGTLNDLFVEEALHRLSVASPESTDRHASLIEPLDRDVRGRFIELAEHRLHVGPTEPLQIDGARFLSRSTDPRATLALMRAFERTNQDEWNRLAALEGLATRAATDTSVLGLLRDARAGEPQSEIRAELDRVLGKLNAR